MSIVGDIPYYRELKKFLILIGQYPQQTNCSRNTLFIMILTSLVSLLIPTIIGFVTSFCEHDTDKVLDAIPIMVTNLVTMIKLINFNINRKKFRKLYDFVISEWESLKFKNEVQILDEITKTGSNIAFLYRTALLGSLVLFAFLPLIPLFLDIVLPLNETRLKQQVFKLNYLVDDDKYFYPIYFHSIWTSTTIVVTIVTVDSMYMLVTHHACGLFAICGNRIKQTTQSFDKRIDNAPKERAVYQEFKNCAIIHKEAIQFYELINDINQRSFLLQIGLNMIGISVTAVQTVMNLNNVREALRIGIFLGAQQFHLFFNSLPGQSLVDRSLQLLDDLYSSKWYQAPVRMQRVIYMMQIRSGVPCTLTAGGLYDMNIENFGMIFKSCMSYFTMLLSLRE
ncbi:putative odorant receptor 71a [Colletes gigas]|uniref:putative odorant receptor 71a n=1 Tax=Colletes gigas TaxID=935657 RepID=UPI001C9B3A69|nr:putative odorant receptor 71a [Colletes gigas]